MRGFISDHLPNGPDDWACVEDFYGSWTGFGFYETCNVCAHYSPSRQIVRFGGMWFGTPDMTATSEPTAEQVTDWAFGANTHFARRVRAATRRRVEFDLRMAALEARIAREGFAWATVRLRRPNGSERLISEPCGLRHWIDILRAATRFMRTHEPAGTCLAHFRIERGLTSEEIERRKAVKRMPAPLPVAA